jgi:hypothetical protein
MVNQAMKLKLEMVVYYLASQMIEGYSGGCWKFDEKACAWIPKGNEKHEVSNCNNYFEGVMDSFTVGLALSALASNHLSWAAHDKGDMASCRAWNDAYNSAMVASEQLSEGQAGLFYSFLD